MNLGPFQGLARDDDLNGRDPVPFSVVDHAAPADRLTDEFPLRLTTGRALDSYNTGVQSGGYRSPNRVGETVDLSPADARSIDVADGDVVTLDVTVRLSASNVAPSSLPPRANTRCPVGT